MNPELERRVNRRLTLAFIATDPVEIALVPRSQERTPTGGMRKDAAAPRQPQTFRLIEPSDSGYRSKIQTAEGSQETVDFLLLGAWGAEVGKDDVFTHGGREYKVDNLMPDNGYEVRATVVRHGW